MPQFSACYFCGTALDAPLAEYPVVPEALHPSADEQRTVVLCSGCRRKLGAVVDAVVSAVDDPPSAESVQQDLAAATNGTSADDDDAYTSTTEDAATETEGPSGDGAFEFDDEVETSPGTGEDATDADPTVAAENVDAPSANTATQSTDETAGSSVSDEPTVTDQGDVEGAEDSESDEAVAGDGEATPNGDDETNSNDDGSGQSDAPSLTALEYNKVMRLLQNREFPVDHTEFKAVATNAYEISNEEFDAIVEAAADRGLIELEGGQILDG